MSVCLVKTMHEWVDSKPTLTYH